MNNAPLFITGIGTDVGKTIVSAILTEKLKADYWKPVQAGDLDNSDTQKVQRLISNTHSKFHSEAYRLTQPYSPHKAAALDHIAIDPNQIVPPQTDNQLIVEGAGGLMVPLNNKYLMIDLIQELRAEVILVSSNYLGSINHTLLSVEILKQRSLPIKGIIFNGKQDNYSEDLIRTYTGIEILGKIEPLIEINKASVAKAGNSIII